MSVKDEIQDQLKSKGQVKLNAETIDQFTKPEERPDEAPEPDVGAEMAEETAVDVDKEAAAKENLLLNAAATLGSTQSAIAKEMILAGTHAGVSVPEEVILTPEEKDSFLQAVISNSRWTQRYTIYGGRVEVVLRSRLTDEGSAIISEMQRRYQNGDILDNIAYSHEIMLAAMIFQVEQLNGVMYEDRSPGKLKATATKIDDPLDPTGKRKISSIKAPDWYEDMHIHFGNMNEAMVRAVYQLIIDFETKYWVMVKNSGDQNFWNLEGSTSE